MTPRTIPAAESTELEFCVNYAGLTIAFSPSDLSVVGEGDGWKAAVSDLGKQLEQRDRRAFASTTPGALS